MSLKGLVVVKLHMAPTYGTFKDTGSGTGTPVDQQDLMDPLVGTVEKNEEPWVREKREGQHYTRLQPECAGPVDTWWRTIYINEDRQTVVSRYNLMISNPIVANCPGRCASGH